MSSERLQYRGRWRALVAFLLAVGCMDLGLGSGDGTQYSEARLIDRVCDSGSFQLTGSAKVTTGITADSCGFVIGPEPGAVSFDLGNYDLSNSTVSALISGSDSGSAEWTSAYFSYPPTPSNPTPSNPTLSNPAGQKIRVLDLRVTYTPAPGMGCSVSALGTGARRR